jgi:Na+(H+)/acetate symporter ActP
MLIDNFVLSKLLLIFLKKSHMKETLKKTFNTNVLVVVGVVFGIGLIFQFIVFPGLTASDTIQNILALLVGIFSLLFAFHFVQWKKFFDFLSDEEEIKPGETELDYIPQDEIVKKKRNTKQFDGIKSEVPFVKTRKKPKKSEFPMEPHHVVHPKVKTKKK